ANAGRLSADGLDLAATFGWRRSLLSSRRRAFLSSFFRFLASSCSRISCCLFSSAAFFSASALAAACLSASALAAAFLCSSALATSGARRRAFDKATRSSWRHLAQSTRYLAFSEAIRFSRCCCAHSKRHLDSGQ